MQSPYLNLYLGRRKRLWLAHCKKLNKNPSTFIREWIEQQLSISEPLNHCSSSETPPQSLVPTNISCKKENFKKEPRERIHLRLLHSEKIKIEECANQNGCSPQVWILNVVRTVLTRQLECGTPELDRLGESNYQLLAIGRNLNQTVKHLNQGLGDPPSLNEIRFLRNKIEAHTRLVNRAIRASIERWGIE